MFIHQQVLSVLINKTCVATPAPPMCQDASTSRVLFYSLSNIEYFESHLNQSEIHSKNLKIHTREEFEQTI